MSRHLNEFEDDQELLFAEKLREALGCTIEDIAIICECASEVCNKCWNAPIGCRCMNDE